jgi:hypothetical protein
MLVQDTTEVDVTRPEQQVEGAGPLDGDTRRGALLHVLHAFTPNGVSLGTLRAMVLVRSDDKPLNATLNRSERQAIPIEDKESYRWLQTLRQAQAEAQLHPDVEFVCVSDSEADIYELLVEAAHGPRNAHYLVRACQDRALLRERTKQGSQTDLSASLRPELLAATTLYRAKVSVRGRNAKVSCEDRGRRQPRKSRTANVEVRAARVTFRPPGRPDRKLPPISMNAVLVREPNPPAGEPAVEWTLLTDLPIATVQQTREIVDNYCTRWLIEVFFRTLKSGCRVEKRRFEHFDRLMPCLALYLIVTWRTLYVCRLGRSCPDMSCEAVFEPAEWRPVYRVVCDRRPPKRPPALQEMVILIAQLGGYVKRKEPPGPQTVWLGLQRMHDFSLCWKIFGPGAGGPG